MAQSDRSERPGELFLDRYMPSTRDAEREEAYGNLKDLIAIIVEIDDRLRRERRSSDSPESAP